MVHEFKNPKFDDIKNDLIEYVYNERENDPAGQEFSNRGGWQSTPFKISDENNIIHSYIYDSIANFTVVNQGVRMYIDAWMNINPKGSFNEKHTHPGCAFAGTIWIKIPENSGNLYFYSPFGHGGFYNPYGYGFGFRNRFFNRWSYGINRWNRFNDYYGDDFRRRNSSDYRSTIARIKSGRGEKTYNNSAR